MEKIPNTLLLCWSDWCKITSVRRDPPCRIKQLLFIHLQRLSSGNPTLALAGLTSHPVGCQPMFNLQEPPCDTYTGFTFASGYMSTAVYTVCTYVHIWTQACHSLLWAKDYVQISLVHVVNIALPEDEGASSITSIQLRDQTWTVHGKVQTKEYQPA